MKLKNRVYILLVIEGLVFLCLTYLTFRFFLNENHISKLTLKSLIYLYSSIVLLMVFYVLSTIWAIYKIIFIKIDNLNKEILPNYLHNKSGHGRLDELAAISAKIKLLNEKVKTTDENLDERVRELQILNDQLQQEISKHELAEHEFIIHKEHLVRLAHYDNLTSLPNRIFFNEILNKAINNAKRNNRILAILIINIDHFKFINTKYNHRIGNLVLKEIGHRFKHSLRTGDVIARLGGDEFIILLHDIENPKFVSAIANKLLLACKQKIKINSYILHLSASIGVSIFPNDGETLEDLQLHADMAMYRAKHAGGNTYQYFGQAMDIAAHEHAKLETMLKHALENNEFVLHFQPQLNLEKGTITSVEALIRWKHPVLGLLGPEEFIRFTEEIGLIKSIDRWVLHEACSVNKTWQKEGYEPIIVSINISPKLFHDENLVELIEEALHESKLDPEFLCIEIAETFMIDNLDIAVDKLKKIHDIGVQIAIDDFGTGYTSINYLKKLPVNILKIDQSFIKGIPYNQNDVAITSAVISLGHNLQLKVVAEGVESNEQIQFLAEQKCDLIQGYFLSRPLAANKLIFQFRKRGKAINSIIEHGH